MDRSQRLLGQGVLRCGGKPGNAEISHLHAAVPQHHDIVGLNVPVDNAPAVGVGEALHNLGDKMQRLTPVQRLSLLLHVLLEGNPVNQFHHDIVQIVRVGDVVHRNDIGVGQHGDSLGLVMKPAPELSVLSQVTLQNFDGNQPVEPVAAGLVYHCHAAGADALQNFISVIE